MKKGNEWVEVKIPAHLVALMGKGTRCFQKTLSPVTDLNLFVTRHPDTGWHMSISHRQFDQRGKTRPGRNPTWEEIRDARYEFIPDEVTMAMFLPPKAEYVNVHDTTFHLWEVPSDVAP